MKFIKWSICTLLLFIFQVLFFSEGYSQPNYTKNVGIGTTTPDPSAVLDLSADSMGFLAPRLTSAQRNAILLPARGLLVYDIDTKNFWYFDGTAWQMMENSQSDWSLTGNANTIATTNFIGTRDNVDFLIKTGGSGAVFERMRVLGSGNIIINCTTPHVNDVFSVYASGATGAINTLGTSAINGYSGITGIGVYGENLGTGFGVYGKSTTSGTGVYGTNDGTGDGVWGDNGGSTGAGVRGQSSNSGIGVYGGNDASGIGVNAYNSGTGNALVAINSNMAAGAGYAIYGQASYFTSFGLYAINTHTLGTGLISVGNNTLPIYLPTGSGGAFTGFGTGTFALAEDQVAGTGLLSVGNYLASYSTLANGSGVAANGFNIGVYGLATSIGNLPSDTAHAGGYFVDGTGGISAYAYVGMFDGIANRKIVGNGTVNTIVKDMNNKPVMLSAPEAPENLFQDYGTGKLVNGKATIQLDPVYSKNISVSTAHPLRVFIQLEGDCKGVYVTNKTQNGFEVIELNGGTSNVEFTWFATANRADETRTDGFVLKYSQERFTKAPKPQDVVKTKPSSVTKKFNFTLDQLKLKSFKSQIK